jgi:hypothetical protein
MLRGSVLPAGILVHLPSSPGTPQFRHAPEQALSQQKPSTHWAESHSSPPVQDWPFFFFPQSIFAMPLTCISVHLIPGAQSRSPFLEQSGLQAPLVQRKGAQSVSPASRQVPRPSQVRAVLREVSSEQVGLPHGVFSG